MIAAAASPLETNRAYYDAHADDFRKHSEALSIEELYVPFLRMLPRGAHILDAGCGSGRDTAALLSRRYRVTAIDASPAMVHAAKRHGLDARVMTFQRMTFDEEFDGIWACASVLHVPHAEIPEVLRRFHRALRERGILYVSLKEGHGERIEDDGRFFSYFTLQEFTELLERAKFRLLNAWQSTGKESSGTARSWLNFLAKR